MADITLETPRLTVTLADGRTLTVQAMNPDMILWDRTAAKHGWPSMAKAPFLWMTFLAWSALRRTGQLAEVTWETFSDTLCIQVRSEDRPNGAAAPADLLGDFRELLAEREDEASASVGPMSGAPEPG